MNRFVTAPLEQAINAYLKLDADVSRLLCPLQGKVVSFDVKGIPLVITMKFQLNHVEVIDNFYGIVDATIVGTPISLFLLNKSDDSAQAFFSSDVEIHGDTEVAQQVSDLFKLLDIDWEEHLSSLVGDSISHKVGNFVRSIVSLGRKGSATMQENLSEYLHEELRHFPPRREVNDFLDDIDCLRADTDRLQSRVERLKKSEG